VSSASPFPSRGFVIAAVALVGVLIAGVVVLAVIAGRTDTAVAPPPAGPVALVPVDAPSSGSPDCKKLLAALPDGLISNGKPLGRAQIASPAPAATVAWGTSDAPVVLRCGLSRPPELTRTSSLRVVSGVQWLPVDGDDATTWYAVDRSVTVALTIPGSAGTGPIQDVSAVISRSLSVRAVFG
jgi:hypothetical protein